MVYPLFTLAPETLTVRNEGGIKFRGNVDGTGSPRL